MRESAIGRRTGRRAIRLHPLPVGGGGLIAGTALAEKYFGQGAEVIAVEPEACDDMCRSLISHAVTERG